MPTERLEAICTGYLFKAMITVLTVSLIWWVRQPNNFKDAETTWLANLANGNHSIDWADNLKSHVYFYHNNTPQQLQESTLTKIVGNNQLITMTQIHRGKRICPVKWSSTRTTAQLSYYAEVFQLKGACFQWATASILWTICILSSLTYAPWKEESNRISAQSTKWAAS